MEELNISAKLKLVVTLILMGSLLVAGPASAHPVGVCVDEESQRQTDRCEAWSVVYDDPSIQPPHRSDQFPTAVAMSDSTVFTTVKNVALDPDSPYDATSEWLVLAHDRATGEPVWSAARNSRPYDSPLAVAISPDGSVVYVTGAAYDAFSVAATDSRVVTVAYDATTGTELWSQTWDGRPDGTDVGKTITVSGDGRVVLIGGVTSIAPGDLDFLTIAYDTRRGKRCGQQRSRACKKAEATRLRRSPSHPTPGSLM